MSTFNNNSTFNYNGDIKLELKLGETTLISKNYTNHGHNNLFKFLCMCLAGDFNSAAKFRPTKIRLYNNTTENVDKAIIDLDNYFTSTDITQPAPSSMTAVTGFITLDSAPVVKVDPVTKVPNVILHFLVPYSFLALTESTAVNQIMIYSPTATLAEDLRDNVLAYFLLTKKDSENKNVWDAINLTNMDKSTNLLIEWSMTVKNFG